MVDLLLHARAKSDARDQGGDTPLHEACISGNYNVAKLLLQYKYESIPATFDNKNKETSVDPKHEERLVNLKNNTGKTPLFCAVENQKIHVVELLLDNEANADLKDNSGESPLAIAARTLKEDIFLMVLTKVKNPSVADDENQTPLLWLIRNNMELAATALLQRDVDMEIHPEHDMGPLHQAVRNCSLDSFSLVGRLLSKGANPLWTDSQGMTALHMAAARGFLDLLKSVLKTLHKMEPVFKSKYDDKQGRNLLHHAACSGSLDVVRYLLEDHNGKAVIDTPDGDGWAPLHWAAKSGSKEVLAKLLSHGADPHTRGPLHDHAVVQVLQHYGHNALVKEFPALVLQYGKTAEADLVSTESEEDCREWKA